MKILITGKNGQLGQSFFKIIKNSKEINQYIFTGRDELDLSSTKSIQFFFKKKKFDIIINCAAFTAVDHAEKESDLANQINNIAVGELAKIAKANNSKLIHISTDYVFDGKKTKPYLETDFINPINIYGKTKSEKVQLKKDVIALESAGVFAIVIEATVESVASRITKLVKIPCIGIGASLECRGQILVTEDLIGLTDFKAKFIKNFCKVSENISSAVNKFTKQVENREFPKKRNTYRDL